MSGKTKYLGLIMPLLAAVTLSSICAPTVRAQEEDERRLWDGAFLKKRAEAKTPPAETPARKPTAYRRVTPKKPSAPTVTATNPLAPTQTGAQADGEVI